MLGPAMLIGGVGGLLLSGRITDKLVRRDVRWYARVPAIATLAAVPFSAAVLLIPQANYELFGTSFASYWLVISLITIPGAAYISYMGPANALMQNMVVPHMRAMTVAIFLLVTNLISLTPGTLSLDVTPDRKTLIVHAMYADDPEDVVRGLKDGMERMVKEVFE